MPEVSLVVVNWNGGDLLRKCLQHVRAQTVLPDEVIVVDNASTDHSIAQLEPWDRMTVLRMPDNLGFAAGNNHAIARGASRYVVLLNPDAFPAPDWLERLLAAAAAYPQAASFGSRQLCWGDTAKLDGIGDTYHLSGTAWREAHGVPQDQSHLVAREIFAPCAAAALYRRAALDEVGGFDESYFCYMEDVDLGFRLRLAGHTARYVPDAVVEHVGGATSGGGRSDFAVFHGHRNLVWTYVKNMPGWLFWLLLPLHVAVNLAALAAFSLRGQMGTVARAKWAALKGLPGAWRQRQRIQRKRTASIGTIWRALDKRLWPRPR
ncbi:MAG: putative glycosyltransferase [Rhodoferax sp.]|nr:putative glycosyltransferase [Rhodoferax sp.]